MVKWRRPLCFFVMALAALIVTRSTDSAGLPRAEAFASPPQVGSCQVLPADNVWNSPVEGLPKDPNSAAYVSTIGADRSVHPDFGSGTWNGGPIGIPYTTVQDSQARVRVSFEYADESDPGPYPIPSNVSIEGGPNSSGDRHLLVVDQSTCILYELYAAYPQTDGSWKAGSGAVFDLKSNVLRPSTWTSADAAGLPILPGLVRYDEVASGEINHAIRFTAPQTRRSFVWPARHFASRLTGSEYPPMGQRFRLRADFDVSRYAPEVQVILRALKKYGMVLADNGSAWYLSGAPDDRWHNDVLVSQLRGVKGSDFEAVDVSSLMVDPDLGQARSGATPLPSPPAQSLPLPSVRFQLGFKVLADIIPNVVGLPLDSEHYGPNGDSMQQTTNGLMVWRKADNWTAFTDGSRTWVNGPYGVMERSNDDRFDWEPR